MADRPGTRIGEVYCGSGITVRGIRWCGPNHLCGSRYGTGNGDACHNNSVGYDQSQRTTLYTPLAAGWDLSEFTFRGN